ncbi:MAG TPA: hypothetical protein VF173_15465 [Thermoanaerobaculia bacterium]|nr:hypothetical protein [Thermoanaerobaculia bacterium]
MQQPIVNAVGFVAPAALIVRQPDNTTELKPERVQELLQAMPGWTLNTTRKSLERLLPFPDARVALAYAAFATELAGANRQPVSILVSGGWVGLTLLGQARKGKKGGMTMAVIELAKRLG